MEYKSLSVQRRGSESGPIGGALFGKCSTPDRGSLGWEQGQLWRVERQLARLLADSLGCDGAALHGAQLVPWASVTFSGARHVFTVTLESGALPGLIMHERAAAFCDTAQEADWALNGAFVADMTATIAGDQLTIEALTVLD